MISCPRIIDYRPLYVYINIPTKEFLFCHFNINNLYITKCYKSAFTSQSQLCMFPNLTGSVCGCYVSTVNVCSEEEAKGGWHSVCLCRGRNWISKCVPLWSEGSGYNITSSKSLFLGRCVITNSSLMWQVQALEQIYGSIGVNPSTASKVTYVTFKFTFQMKDCV